MSLQPATAEETKRLLRDVLECSECGNFDRALSLVEKALELEPQNAVIHRTKALVLLKTQRFDEAEQACRLALQLKPTGSRAQDILARIEQRRVFCSPTGASPLVTMETSHTTVGTNQAVLETKEGLPDNGLADEASSPFEAGFTPSAVPERPVERVVTIVCVLTKYVVLGGLRCLLIWLLGFMFVSSMIAVFHVPIGEGRVSTVSFIVFLLAALACACWAVPRARDFWKETEGPIIKTDAETVFMCPKCLGGGIVEYEQEIERPMGPYTQVLYRSGTMNCPKCDGQRSISRGHMWWHVNGLWFALSFFVIVGVAFTFCAAILVFLGA